jgi:hypothetical protein
MSIITKIKAHLAARRAARARELERARLAKIAAFEALPLLKRHRGYREDYYYRMDCHCPNCGGRTWVWVRDGTSVAEAFQKASVECAYCFNEVRAENIRPTTP